MGEAIPWSAIAQVVGAVILFAGGWLTVRHNQWQGSYDQVQEDLLETRKDRDAKQQLIDQRDRTIRIQGDYIEQLRRQIRDEVGPPPVAYPKELIG